jgi:ABC-type multidrug transport system fused ATPase/permease subunit
VILFVWTVIFIYGSHVAAKKSEVYSRIVSECNATMSGLLSDSVSNVMSTKLFYNLNYESLRIRAALDALVAADRRMLWFNLKSRFFQGLFVSVLVASLVYYLILGVKEGWVTPGDFAMVLSLASWMATSVWDLGRQMLELSKAIGACQQALSFISIPHEIVDAPDATSLQVNQGEIVFEEVIDASHKACCEEFIRELPEGYQSLVGERGVKLSGGQKQRIAIARAFLKNAPILLLDEATSALDTVTERLIQTSLHEIMQGKTTIVIAHRLSTLKDMDRILFFDNGVVVEQGTLDELLSDPKGQFYQLWEMQSEGFIS